MNELQNLVALITGGCGGIGAATARVFRDGGASVAVLDLDTRSAPEDVLALACDVTDTQAVADAVASVADQFGGLDILVNNAGIGAVGDVAANDDEQWARVLDVNVTSIARVTRAALPYLRASAHPAIVNTCSAVAHVGVRQRALYSATKGAVEALTLAMAADHVADGIRVNAVSPGTTETPWVTGLLERSEDPESASRALRARQPLGRLVSPEEVGMAIAFLASPSSSATTGSVMRVDGGMTNLRI